MRTNKCIAATGVAANNNTVSIDYLHTIRTIRAAEYSRIGSGFRRAACASATIFRWNIA